MFVSVGSTIVDYRLIGKKREFEFLFFLFHFTGGFFAGKQTNLGIFQNFRNFSQPENF
jgi:hypothetical protein